MHCTYFILYYVVRAYVRTQTPSEVYMVRSTVMTLFSMVFNPLASFPPPPKQGHQARFTRPFTFSHVSPRIFHFCLRFVGFVQLKKFSDCFVLFLSRLCHGTLIEYCNTKPFSTSLTFRNLLNLLSHPLVRF